MSPEHIVVIIGAVFAVLGVAVTIGVRIPKRLKANYFVAKWKELQGFCKQKDTWPTALIEADKLLDKALKKRKYKGKTMGERMVAAQRTFSDNDSTWFAHNLAKKIISDPAVKLKESDVKNALVGFRQALRDIGALPNDKSRDT